MQTVIEVADILVQNTSDALIDSRGHFLLHYLVAPEVPGTPQVPRTIVPLPACEKIPTIGAGCSNSSYP